MPDNKRRCAAWIAECRMVASGEGCSSKTLSIASVYACRNVLGGQHAVAGQVAPNALMEMQVAQDWR